MLFTIFKKLSKAPMWLDLLFTEGWCWYSAWIRPDDSTFLFQAEISFWNVKYYALMVAFWLTISDSMSQKVTLMLSCKPAKSNSEQFCLHQLQLQRKIGFTVPVHYNIQCIYIICTRNIYKPSIITWRSQVDYCS